MENILVCIEIEGQVPVPDQPQMDTFQAYISYHRRRLKLTQIELADKADIGQSYVSGLERGINKEPTNDILVRIAVAIGRPVEEVFAAAGKVYKGNPLPPGTELRVLPSGREAYVKNPSGQPMEFTAEDLMDLDLIFDLLEKRKERS